MAKINVSDVSRWQGTINWDEFRKHIDAVVIKASGADGGLYVDGMLRRNRDEARRVGVPRWYYHYKGAGTSPEAQAEHFIRAIGGLQPGEGVVLDDENESQINVDFAVRFGKRIRELTGINQVLYSNQARFRGDLSRIVAMDVGAWVAKYGRNTGTVEGAGAKPTIPQMHMIMWQYTSMARVGGVTANTVDMNIFYGTVDQFQKYGAPGNVPAPSKPAPAPKPAPVPSSSEYVVTSRDSDGLAAAMRRIGISDWKAVADLNGLRSPYVIRVGDRLKLKKSTPVKPQTGTYTVRSADADGLAAAMARIGVSNWKAVADHNGLRSPYVIYPGQVLRLPGGTPSTNTSRAFYVVKKTDSDGLAAAMRRIGISNWKRVADLNGLKSPYIIKPNDKLWLN